MNVARFLATGAVNIGGKFTAGSLQVDGVMYSGRILTVSTLGINLVGHSKSYPRVAGAGISITNESTCGVKHNVMITNSSSRIVETASGFNYINTGASALVIRRNATTVANFQANGC